MTQWVQEYWELFPSRRLAFQVQYRASRGGPPVRYSYQNYEDWCGLAVLYCQYSPALHAMHWTTEPQSFQIIAHDFNAATELSSRIGICAIAV